MAQRTIVQLVSDLTGEDIAEGKGETVSFTLDGATYELDLTKKEADKFRGLFQDYIAAGRRVGGSRAKRTSSPSGAHSKEELANIRAWANANGYSVSGRGRIKAEVVEAYHVANG